MLSTVASQPSWRLCGKPARLASADRWTALMAGGSPNSGGAENPHRLAGAGWSITARAEDIAPSSAGRRGSRPYPGSADQRIGEAGNQLDQVELSSGAGLLEDAAEM